MTHPVARAALDRALEEKDLLLVYQPIHDARTRDVYSVEALLRQRRQSGELREASIITAAAEQGPELYRLDSWMIKRAVTDAAGWPWRLNVNLSPREFQDPGIVDRVNGVVSACGMDIRKLNLELTETKYIKEPNETMTVLQELKRLGAGLWLDDFGTKHSNLEHLQHFPADGIKIAGSFVKPLPDDVRSRKITRALINLAHDLGMKVVAEEVETEEQLDFLISHGCDYIQGFLFSKPMEKDELRQFF
jgi:EAL domain-containing protein (putative c-di-GMP-specific phosphodiesterase class I)